MPGWGLGSEGDTWRTGAEQDSLLRTHFKRGPHLTNLYQPELCAGLCAGPTVGYPYGHAAGLCELLLCAQHVQLLAVLQ